MMEREPERPTPPAGEPVERRRTYYETEYPEGRIVEYPRATVVPLTSVGFDAVQWGAIAAGTALAFVVFLALSLLAIGIGLAATGTAAGVPAGTTAQITGLVAGVIGVIAFFLGGWMAGRTCGLIEARDGVLNGLLVPAVFLGLLFLFGSLAASAVAGAPTTGLLGNLVPGPGVNLADVTQAGALGGFVAIVVWLIAGALGGLVGAQSITSETTPASARPERRTVH